MLKWEIKSKIQREQQHQPSEASEASERDSDSVDGVLNNKRKAQDDDEIVAHA